MSFLPAPTIGKIIRQQRAEKEMSQRQLAYLVRYQFPSVKCSGKTLSAIEGGRQEISISQLGAIASVLEVPMDIFISQTYSKTHRTEYPQTI